MLAIADKQEWLDIADNYDVPLLYEAFADRRYLSSGQLAPRSLPGSVITDEDEILDQITQIAKYGKVRTLDGYTVSLEADTICVHGDNEDAIQMIERIRETLNREE